MTKEGHSEESAKKICGTMEQTLGGSNLAEYVIDANGDLYLKYYFADKSTARGSAVGEFSLDDPALDLADKEAIGLPFSILPSRDLSIKKDFHPWSPKEGATYDDHVNFARQYSPGHIVTLTRDSNLVSAAMSDIKANNGRLAVVKITHEPTRDAYKANPSLIPRAVSPGFMNLETPNLTNIKKVKWAHLAAVPKGAYGDKATLYGTCIGGNECVNALVAAAVIEESKKPYCPVGASENLVTSHDISNNNTYQMSDNANTVQTSATPPVAAVQPTTPIAPTSTPPKGAPITAGTTPAKKLVRLQKPNNQAVTPTGNEQQQQQDGTDDITTLKEEVAKMREIQQQNERREQIKRLIPKELFINKGKFDEKAFEAEVEKKLQRNETDEQINDYYNLWMEKQRLINAGFEVSQAQPNQELQMTPPTPTGGGSYKTPSDVPVPVGGSADNYVLNSVRELISRTIIRRDA